MTVKSSRHIRHDWQTFNDSRDRKTVTTVCGVRTSVENAGIPGVTEQPPTVVKSGSTYWGWCKSCVIVAWGDSYVDLTRAGAGIEALYTAFRTAIFNQAAFHLRESLKRAGKDSSDAEVFRRLQ
jgi:hypothetical protein